MEIVRNLISSLYQAISKINILLRLTLKTLMFIEIEIDSCKHSACSSPLSLILKKVFVALEVVLFSAVKRYLPVRIAAKIEQIKDKLCALDMKILLEPLLSQQLLQTHFRSRLRDFDKTRIDKDNNIENEIE